MARSSSRVLKRCPYCKQPSCMDGYSMDFKAKRGSYKGTLTLSGRCFYCRKRRKIVFKGAWPQKMSFGEMET